MNKIDYDSIGLELGSNKQITDDNYNKDLAVKCRNGTFVGTKIEDVLSWKGIPFAKPPIGKLRFKPPQKVDDSDLIYESYNYGKKPILTTVLSNTEENSEDCLYLNIFTGDNKIENKAVMVWIHGGGFIIESASSEDYRGDTFAKIHPDVILVTIEYRLGLFGFSCFEDIEGGEEFKGSVNNGIRDQIMALKWINENIEQFGGDKNNITIFGESAGAISASLLPIIDDAKGLFQKAIIQSGTPNCAHHNKKLSKKAVAKVCELFNCKNMNDLQKIDINEIIKHTDELDEACSQYSPMGDDILIPKNPLKAYEEGKASDVKIIVGYNANECRYYLKNAINGDEKGTENSFKPWMEYCYNTIKSEMDEKSIEIAEDFIKNNEKSETYSIEELMSEMSFGIGTRALADASSKTADTYLYFFEYPNKPYPTGPAHGCEIPIIFNKDNLCNKVGNFEKLKKQMGEIWISFAKNGVPTLNGKEINKYNSANKKVIVFNEKGNTEIKEDYFKKIDEKLKPLLKYEPIAIATNFTSPASQREKYIDGEIY